MTQKRKYSGEEIQAYLDGELEAAIKAEIDAAIASDKMLARRIEEYRRNDVLLGELDLGRLDKETPPALEKIALRQATASEPEADRPAGENAGNFRSIRNIAAAVALLAIGFTSGQLVEFPSPQKPKNYAGTWIYRAVGAHKVYSGDAKRPVEIPADRPEDLLNWVSNRMGARVRDVRLDGFGYTYLGGRLATDGLQPAGQLLYSGGDNRKVTIFVRRGSGNKSASTRMVEIDGIKAVFWSMDDLDYAVIGEVSKSELFSIARANGG